MKNLQLSLCLLQPHSVPTATVKIGAVGSSSGSELWKGLGGVLVVSGGPSVPGLPPDSENTPTTLSWAQELSQAAHQELGFLVVLGVFVEPAKLLCLQF